MTEMTWDDVAASAVKDTEDISYCPYCGGGIRIRDYTRHLVECDGCGAKFRVIKDYESGKI